MSIRRARAAVVAALLATTLAAMTLAPAAASTDAAGGGCRAGAPGVGDPYYPLYGNGGYDVQHYLLKIRYNPATDRLVGVATITARRRTTCAASTSTSRG
jgi:hypothetical protein